MAQRRLSLLVAFQNALSLLALAGPAAAVHREERTFGASLFLSVCVLVLIIS